jgi:receptor-type tyrosine-protein phosphatase N
LGPDTEHQLYVVTFLLCGVISALLVAATALYVIRRHARSREKLQNLTAPDTEASKDYQVRRFPKKKPYKKTNKIPCFP